MAMTRESFVARFGGVFENSPWIAGRAWDQGPPVDDAYAAMNRVIEAASREEQLALIRAHPDLGTRAKISDNSTAEQAGAGLDRLTRQEFERLSLLNAAYQQKFGFPFIFAVRGADKGTILAALEQRLHASPEEEFAEALRQIGRIAKFRLETIIK